MIDENSFISSLVVAVVLGAFLGIERSIAGKHAGMRTFALVSLGSCLFVIVGILSSFEFSAFAGVNPLQLAGPIIIGIGFIGSGLAVFRGEHPVELTTATGIWVAAGVGMACGFGYFSLAVTATILTICIFWLFLKVENNIRARYGKERE